jgi:hypothetical protein
MAEHHQLQPHIIEAIRQELIDAGFLRAGADLPRQLSIEAVFHLIGCAHEAIQHLSKENDEFASIMKDAQDNYAAKMKAMH